MSEPSLIEKLRAVVGMADTAYYEYISGQRHAKRVLNALPSDWDERLEGLVEAVQRSLDYVRHSDQCQPISLEGCRCGLWALKEALSRWEAA